MHPEAARALAESLLGGTGNRWQHVEGVAARAHQLAQILEVQQRDVLVSAAWLHDVGYAPDVQTTGLHAIDGASFLSKSDVDDVIVSLVAHHTGAAVEAEERGLAEVLQQFPKPPAVLLDILTAADVLTGPVGISVEPRERIAEILRRYGPNDPVHRAVSRSGPDLIATAERVTARLADVSGGASGVKAVGDAETH